MVETVLGEGGIKMIPKWCLKGLRKICDQKKILLICERFTRIGRSGKFSHLNIQNKTDIVPIAKGIGGGPLGAVLMNKKVAMMTPLHVHIWWKTLSYESRKCCLR